MQPTPDLVGTIGADGALVFLAVCAFALFMLCIGYPVLAIIAVRRLTRIARALEDMNRLNGTVGSRPPQRATALVTTDPAGDVPLARPSDRELEPEERARPFASTRVRSGTEPLSRKNR